MVGLFRTWRLSHWLSQASDESRGVMGHGRNESGTQGDGSRKSLSVHTQISMPLGTLYEAGLFLCFKWF